MSTKEKPKLLKRLGQKLKGRRAPSPAPSATQLTGPYAPPFLSAADAQATRPGTNAKTTNCYQPAAASQTPPPTLPVEPQPKPAVTESTKHPTFTLSASQRLWNAAYNSLEVEDAKLIGSYIKTLEKVLGGGTDKPSATDFSAKLKDPTARQMHMKKLVQKGQEKISKASRITTGVGEVADFILSAKEMVDLKDARRDDIKSACRRDLRVVDPQHDMERIEKNKDELLDDAYK
ncbi:hypothetical protein DL768_010511 [Monosporascus sp. mg162]|nr:hypothetical protein DL768_010511 [Monosporascus sp. mg162]